jgi:hypothetical protein
MKVKTNVKAGGSFSFSTLVEVSGTGIVAGKITENVTVKNSATFP